MTEDERQELLYEYHKTLEEGFLEEEKIRKAKTTVNKNTLKKMMRDLYDNPSPEDNDISFTQQIKNKIGSHPAYKKSNPIYTVVSKSDIDFCMQYYRDYRFKIPRKKVKVDLKDLPF